MSGVNTFFPAGRTTTASSLQMKRAAAADVLGVAIDAGRGAARRAYLERALPVCARVIAPPAMPRGRARCCTPHTRERSPALLCACGCAAACLLLGVE